MEACLNNKKRTTLASFLACFVMSGMLAPIGIISGPMSESFAQPVTEITARFGWLAFGILGRATGIDADIRVENDFLHGERISDTPQARTIETNTEIISNCVTANLAGRP